jgi:thiamine-phosphate pyrophosphorylase
LILYYITDRQQFPGDDAPRQSALLENVERAARAGVDFIQLREKDLPTRALARLAQRALERLQAARRQHGSQTRLLINSRNDVAIACGADGVHLRSSSSGEISAGDARAIFDGAGIAHPVIAVSCHTEQEVLLAEADGADFTVFGPVFEKTGVAAAGLRDLERIAQRRPALMPTMALGGVTLENARECIEAGAAGVAGIRLFQQGDVARAVAKLRELQINSPRSRGGAEKKF